MFNIDMTSCIIPKKNAIEFSDKLRILEHREKQENRSEKDAENFIDRQ